MINPEGYELGAERSLFTEQQFGGSSLYLVLFDESISAKQKEYIESPIYVKAYVQEESSITIALTKESNVQKAKERSELMMELTQKSLDRLNVSYTLGENSINVDNIVNYYGWKENYAYSIRGVNNDIEDFVIEQAESLH